MEQVKEDLRLLIAREERAFTTEAAPAPSAEAEAEALTARYLALLEALEQREPPVAAPPVAQGDLDSGTGSRG